MAPGSLLVLDVSKRKERDKAGTTRTRMYAPFPLTRLRPICTRIADAPGYLHAIRHQDSYTYLNPNYVARLTGIQCGVGDDVPQRSLTIRVVRAGIQSDGAASLLVAGAGAEK